MNTPLGAYLDELKINKSRLSNITGITTDRINALSHEATAIPYTDEVFPIIYVANYLSGIPEDKFNSTIDRIYPRKTKNLLINKLKGQSPAAQLFGNYTFQRKDVEIETNIPAGKISKYMNDKNKKAPIEEIIRFIDSIGLDLLETLKKYYGVIDVNQRLKEFEEKLHRG
ncbi:hypothetical protein [Sphingobacterium siyangense]|uniref:hypothetical protein n=1 Tax=Sphingobacterium siyangense TaxID=459529 RepID=UPI003DA6A51A